MFETKSNTTILNEETSTSTQQPVSNTSSLSSGSSLLTNTTTTATSSNNEIIRLPWGAYKERQSYFLNHMLVTNLVDVNSNDSTTTSTQSTLDKKKPGEYVMQLVMLNFVQLTSKKFDQLVSNDKKEKRLKECFQKSDDLQLDQLVQTLGNVAEQCLPSLVRFLLKWYEAQIINLNFLRQQQQQQLQQTESTSQLAAQASKLPNKTRQQQMIQAKQERDFIDERKELPFHPGNEDLLNSIIDLSFKRFLKKDTVTSINYYSQLCADNQYVTDLYAEVIGILAQSRFYLVKRRFLVEFERLRVNISSTPASSTTTSASSVQLNTNDSQSNLINSATSNSSLISSQSLQSSSTQPTTGESLVLSQISSANTNITKLLNGMKYFRIKMVPIEDFEASFQFLNECAQHFVEAKDKDIKYTLAALFVDVLVPITGSVKNEVNIPCLKQFVDVLYPHALELAAKSKHRMSSFPLITCLLCVSQKQFFLNNWFQFAQICMQQFKSREISLNRIALEAIVRLIWVYMIRIKGEKPNETNQRLQTIIQNLFPKSNKLVNPKDMPNGLFIKIIQFIAYEKLDFAMKEIIYELLSIDVTNTTSDLNNSFNNNDLEHLLNSNSDQNNSNSETNNNSSTSSNNQQNDSSNSNNVNTTSNPTSQINSASNTTNNVLQNSLNSANNSSMPIIGSIPFRSSKENVILMPQRMEIGLRSFCLIADHLQQQKEANQSQMNSPPQMPSTSFNSLQTELIQPSIYLQQAVNQINSLNRTRSNTLNMTPNTQSRLMLSDQLAREIGLAPYYEHVRRAFHDILKTLDASIGRPFLLTRPENASNQINESEPRIGDLSSNLESSSNSINLDVNTDTNQSNTSDSTQTFYIDQDSDNSLTNIPNQDSQLMMNAENKQRLCLMRTCVSLLPRLMPLFKETELVEMLTRLLIHIDDELKSVSFQTLKLLVNDYPQWRKCILTGFISFILKEITDLFPKLIEQTLKMLIQLLNVWRTSKSLSQGNLDDYCQLIFHLEGFALFNLCHTHIQRRRYALTILKELKQIGELTKCFRAYQHHSYALDVLDLASVHAIKQLHLHCFTNESKPDLSYLIEQSASWDTNNSTPIFVSNTIDQLTTYSSTLPQLNQQNKSRSTSLLNPLPQQPPSMIPLDPSQDSIDSPPKDLDSIRNYINNNVFTFDPWTECLAIFFSFDFIFTKCPQARADSWPFIFTRLQQLLTYVDPNETHELPRTSILFGSGANSLEKIRKATTERDANLNLWKNYLIAACCLTSGSDRYLYQSDYEIALAKSDDSNETSTQTNLIDFSPEPTMSKFYLNNSVSLSTTQSPLLKMIVPFIKCDCSIFRENIIRGLGRISIEAIRDLIEELNQAYIKEILSEQKRGDKLRRQLKKKDLIRLTIIRIFQLLADQRTLSRRLIDAIKYKNVPILYIYQKQQAAEDQKQLRQIFSDFIENCQIYLEQDMNLDKQQTDLLIQTRLHFCILIHKLIDSIPEKNKRIQLLNASLRTNLFIMCDKWSGRFSSTNLTQTTTSSTSSLKLNQFNSVNTPNLVKSNPSHLYMHQTHYQHHNCFHFYEELELAATKACAALICCDDTLNMLIQSNKLVFPWLNQLIEQANIEMKMFEYCKCTLPNEIYMLCLNLCSKLLEMSSISQMNLNNTKSQIFEWIIQKCFTSSQEIADLCFISLAKVYIQSALNEKQPVKVSNPVSSSNNDRQMNKTLPMHQLLEYHCLNSLFALVLINLGSTRLNIHELSIKMLRVIYKNNFKQLNVNTESSPNDSNEDASQFDLLNSTAVYSKSKLFIAEYLAMNAPEHSLSVFCELTSRFEHCSHQIRKDILQVLVPWLYNIELIDTNVCKSTTSNDKANSQATETILNNLFYLTCKFGDLYSSEFELIWAVLGATYVLNLKIIIRYLFVMVSLATYEMISNVKRVCSYLFKTSPDRIIDELVNELEQMDSFGTILERYDKLPFYKYSKQVLNETSSESSTNNTDSDYSDDEDSSSSNNSDSELFNPILNNNSKSSKSNETSSDEEVSESEDSLNQDNHLDGYNEDSEDSDCSMSKKKKFKYKVNSKHQHQSSHNQLLNRKASNTINVPFNLQTFACPLNVILYHIGHNHGQLNQSNIYSYQKNYLHHNHYEHITNLSRSNISLMLLTDLFGQDAVDTDYWCLYIPCLFHYCLISFDSTKQLIGEHAKKLFLNLLNVLTIQTGLNQLTDQINEFSDAIIDSQSIVFDRKFTNNSLIEPVRRLNWSNETQTCHYNYNYRNNLNSRIQFDRFKSSSSQQYLQPGSGMHRLLTNMSSAPASPTHQSTERLQQQQTQQKTDELTQTARHYLDYLLRVLAKSKNSPVWPNELLTSQNYSKKLFSISLINDFVSGLQQFLQTICVKQNISKQQRLTDKWSQYALRTALNTTNQHYAGRSLQIYRALQIRFTSTSTMLNIMRKLKETCSDETNQSYVVELLLTLKMNANLLACEYNQLRTTNTNLTKTTTTKQKSKSLNTKQVKQEKLNKKKKSATAIAKLSSSEIKSKTSTLPRKKYLKRLNHLNSLYETSLTLNLFDSKWKLLKERIQPMSTRSLSKYHLYFDHLTKRSHQQTLHLLVHIFWSAICLLESDYDHEFVLAIEIINEILTKIDLNTGVVGQLLIHKHEFRTSLEMFTFRINWLNYPGVQNLLLKGCTCSSSPHTIEMTQRLLVKLIPHCFKLNFIDPQNVQKDYGLRGLAMNLMALLPTMILNYEKPTDLCIDAAQQYLKVIKDQCQLIESHSRPILAQTQHQYQSSKLEQLKNLSHVMNSYSLGTFGKDKTQWTKCVITYLYEYFQQCQSDQSNSNSSQFYFDWIIFLTELLDKNISNIQYQQCVFICLNSLLNLISFNDTHIWSFINEELIRVIVKYMNTMLWSEALELIRLTVSKSSSLMIRSTKFFIGQSNSLPNQSSSSSQTTDTTSPFSSKKELPGRTLEFEFDFNQFVPSNSKLPLKLLDFNSMRQQTLESQQHQLTNSWKRPQLSQTKTRDKFQLLLQTLDKNQSINQPQEEEQKCETIPSQVRIIHNDVSPTKIVSILNTSTSSLSKKSESTSSLNTSVSSSLQQLNKPIVNSPKQKNAPIVPIITNDFNKNLKKSHHRTASSATIQINSTNNTLANLIINTNVTASTNTLTDSDHKNRFLNLDDNNFINNTFSFLDDLDKNDPVILNEDEKQKYESVIEPMRDQDLISIKPRAKTISISESSAKLDTISISSKSKPIAPKMNKVSASIGVASGAEALKAMNSMSSSSSNHSVSIHNSANRKLLQEIKQQQLQQQLQQHQPNEKRQSITRIIRSDSFQNSNSSLSTASTNTSQSNQSNVIYDHKTSPPKKPNQLSLPSKTTLKVDNLLQKKRDELRVSSSGSLSSLLALDDSKSTEKLVDSAQNSIRSMTLPGKNSSSQIRSPLHDVNFQIPNKKILNWIQFVNRKNLDEKWSKHLVHLNENKFISQTFYLFKYMFQDLKVKLIQSTRDYLSLLSLKKINDLDKYLVNMINMLTRLESPWLYFDQQVLLVSETNEKTKLLDQHRKLANDLNDKHRSFLQLKLEFNQVFKSGDENSIKLGKLWSKLISQFMGLLQTYTTIILNLTSHRINLKLDDKSDEFNEFKRQLTSELATLNTKLNETSINNKEQCVNLIVDSLENRNIIQIVKLFEFAQRNFFSNELDLDDLIVLACEQSKSQNFIALINTLDDFDQLTKQIMVDNIEIANILNSIEKKFFNNNNKIGGNNTQPIISSSNTNTQQNEEIDC